MHEIVLYIKADKGTFMSAEAILSDQALNNILNSPFRHVRDTVIFPIRLLVLNG